MNFISSFSKLGMSCMFTVTSLMNITYLNIQRYKKKFKHRNIINPKRGKIKFNI